mmetsp:Transcript_8912/g.20796  ORF Transcript_8912/g.20796 Transcript_8912/m.20796 type:complete len:282 (+) Transcript_8912:398-1243(+)
MLQSPLPPRYRRFVSMSKKGKMLPDAWSILISCSALLVLRASQNHNCLSLCFEKPTVANSSLAPRKVTRAPLLPSCPLKVWATVLLRGSHSRTFLSLHVVAYWLPFMLHATCCIVSECPSARHMASFALETSHRRTVQSYETESKTSLATGCHRTRVAFFECPASTVLQLSGTSLSSLIPASAETLEEKSQTRTVVSSEADAMTQSSKGQKSRSWTDAECPWNIFGMGSKRPTPPRLCTRKGPPPPFQGRARKRELPATMLLSADEAVLFTFSNRSFDAEP